LLRSYVMAGVPLPKVGYVVIVTAVATGLTKHREILPGQYCFAAGPEGCNRLVCDVQLFVCPVLQASSDAGSSSAERRQQLVAQLTHEEGAARAALEALKQVWCSTANSTPAYTISKAGVRRHPADPLPCSVLLSIVAMAASARNMAGALSHMYTAV
jgi:hypothetical protein